MAKLLPYNPTLDPEALLAPSEAAAMLGFSIKKLEKDRRENVGIPYVRLAYNRVRYRRQDIIDYAAKLRVVPRQTM